VDEALLAVDPGLELTSFHPHFTVARLDPGHEPKRIAGFVARHADFEAPPFQVTEFHLLASEPRPGLPPAYRTVRCFPLA